MTGGSGFDRGFVLVMAGAGIGALLGGLLAIAADLQTGIMFGITVAAGLLGAGVLFAIDQVLIGET